MDSTSAAAHSGSALPSTPDDDLTAKKAALQQLKDEIANDTQKANVLQAQINDLQARIAEVQQSLADYDPASLLARLNDAKDRLAKKGAIADATLDATTKSDLDAKIKAFKADLDAQGDKAAKASSDATDAAKAATAAATDLQNKQAALETKKATSREIDARLRDMDSLLDQANKAEAAADYTALYFFVGETKRAADAVQIPSLDDARAAIQAAQQALDTAKSVATKAKADASDLAAAAAEANKKYDAARASQRADLLNALKQPNKKMSKSA